MGKIAALALLAPLVLAAGSAHAHAYLDRAEPRVGSSVSVAPRQLSLWFTQKS
jgi:copper resistance protein C